MSTSRPQQRVNPNVRPGDLEELARAVRMMATPLQGRATVEDISAGNPSLRSSTLNKLAGTPTANETNMHAVLAWILDRMAEKGWA